jgi:uroporphyrinogen-III synthase
MRVLVTRPPQSGARTAERLVALGHEPLLLPLFEPMHDADKAFAGLAGTDGPIAVTSAEAIRAMTEQPAATSLAPHLHRPLFAVGDATAEQAKNAGFDNVTASTGNGADLADAIAAETQNSVLYLAGTPRAETFESRARKIGLTVIVAECYRMQHLHVPVEILRNLFADEAPDSILFYSRQTAENFFALHEIATNLDALIGIRLLCLSKSVADAVPPTLQGHVAIAATPDEDSLLSLL